MFLISDSVDIALGLRLVGIQGVVVKNQDEFFTSFYNILQKEDIGIVLIANTLAKKYNDFILKIGQSKECPLFVEV